MVQAPGDEPRYGNQDTDGSRSLRHFLQPMRDCGAACRLMLEMAAAQRWGVDLSQVHAANHEVTNAASGQKLGYGDLAADAAALATPALDKLTFKEPANYRYIGKGNVSIVDLFDITVGKAGYGADHRLPGQVFAVIARPPVVGGKLVSFDGSEALKVPNVLHVLPVQGWQPPGTKFLPVGGVAVVARNTGSAIKGRDALKIVWDDGPNKSHNSTRYRAELEAAVRAPGEMVRNEGDADAALKSASLVVTAEYYVPHLAHATMEPPAALVSFAGGKCEAWAPVQSSWGTREDLAKLLGLPVANVTVNVTLLGGGFGRKSKCDYVLEAGLLSKALGVPVQVQWTREDDIRNGFYHAVAVERIDTGLDAGKKVVAWRHRSAAPTIKSTFIARGRPSGGVRGQHGARRCAFRDPEHTLRDRAGGRAHADRLVPLGLQHPAWFRGPEHGRGVGACNRPAIQKISCSNSSGRRASSIHASRSRKTCSGTMASRGNSYPIDAGRLRHVAELAAEKAGWGRKLPPGHGLGIAAHRSFVTYVATVVEVAVDNQGNLSMPRVDTAIDCGFHVNPERIASQTEGAAVMGLSLAKYGQITYRDGRVQQGNFDDYQVVRIGESPRVTNVHIVPATYDVRASGIGEPPLPPFAPALCNAIFAATGKRIRSLPIGDQLKT